MGLRLEAVQRHCGVLSEAWALDVVRKEWSVFKRDRSLDVKPWHPDLSLANSHDHLRHQISCKTLDLFFLRVDPRHILQIDFVALHD